MSAWALALRAGQALERGKARAALPLLDKLVRLQRSGWALLLRARAKVELGQNRLAVADVTRAFDQEAECGWIFDLPVSRLALPPAQEARALYQSQRAFGRSKDAWPMRAFVGKLKFSAGKAEEGLAFLRQAARAAPKEAYLHAWLAEGLRRMGDAHGAELAARRALRLNPRDGVAHAARAAALRAQGRFSAAFASALEAEKRMPAYEVGFLEAAKAALALEDYPAVLRHLESAVRRASRYGWRSLYEHHPHDLRDLNAMAGAPELASRSSRGKILAWRGEALMGLGRGAEALPCLERAVELNPKFAWAWAWLGLARAAAGQDGRPALDRALRLDPAYGRGRLERARLALEREEFSGALRDADAVLKRDDSWALAWLLRARALAGLGKTREAAFSVERALTLDPRYESALRLRIELSAGGAA